MGYQEQETQQVRDGCNVQLSWWSQRTLPCPFRVETPPGKATEQEILGQAGTVHKKAQAVRAAAFPTPALFFPGFNRDPMIKFPLPNVGSSCAQTPSAAEGDGVFAEAGVAVSPCLAKPHPGCQPGLPSLGQHFPQLRLASANKTSRVTTSKHPCELISVALFWEVWGLSKQGSPELDSPVL